MRVEELEVTFSDGLMLLPVTVEHTIDEKSPLYGHNHETLMVSLQCALNAKLYLLVRCLKQVFAHRSVQFHLLRCMVSLV